MNSAAKKEEILSRLKNEMNGAVARAMEERGLCYDLNYGVSYPTIKKIAKEYYPDHELALSLFNENIRELKIAAVHIDDPAAVTWEQMSGWGASFCTGEVADQAGMWLFYASPDAAAGANEWLESDNPMLLRAALYMTGRRAVTRLSEEKEISDSLKLMVKGIVNGKIKNLNASVYALRCIAERSEALRREVAEATENIKGSESKTAKTIAEDIEALLIRD